MTAGAAIAHSEQSPDPHPPFLHGAQLWVALPDAQRDTAPVVRAPRRPARAHRRAATATLLLGELGGATLAGRSCTRPLVGVDLDARRRAPTSTLPLEPDFEYAVLTVVRARRRSTAAPLEPGVDALPRHRPPRAAAARRRASRLLLLGGEPFEEQIVMWWNFVARTGDEIAASREEWQAELAGSPEPAARARFGDVPGFDGPALAAPAMPAAPLRPADASAELCPAAGLRSCSRCGTVTPSIGVRSPIKRDDRRLPPLFVLTAPPRAT